MHQRTCVAHRQPEGRLLALQDEHDPVYAALRVVPPTGHQHEVAGLQPLEELAKPPEEGNELRSTAYAEHELRTHNVT